MAVDVSVIIPAYNAQPYLTACLDSVRAQTIGASRMEVIAVDDGSTDGTGEDLERFAATFPGVRVLHRVNAGNPAYPRNDALDVATGRYIFMLDADDQLGPEALERLVAMADENGSDVVLGKMVSVGGRFVPMAMFAYDQPKVDLYTSWVYWALNPMKLFRREFIERLGLRFPLDLRYGDDQPFVATAYLNASVISVVADYDCIYWVRRDDGLNLTSRWSNAASEMLLAERGAVLLEQYVEAGPRRDHLLRRHFVYEIASAMKALAGETDPAARVRDFERLKRYVDARYSDGIAEHLAPRQRVALHLVRAGLCDEALSVVRFSLDEKAPKLVGRGGRAFALYPYFGDAAIGVPDECYDVTKWMRARCEVREATRQGDALAIRGVAHIERLDSTNVATVVVVRRRESDDAYPVATERHFDAELAAIGAAEGCDYGMSGFSAVIDPAHAADGAPLGPGTWDVFARVDIQSVVHHVRVGELSLEVPEPTDEP